MWTIRSATPDATCGVGSAPAGAASGRDPVHRAPPVLRYQMQPQTPTIRWPDPYGRPYGEPDAGRARVPAATDGPVAHLVQVTELDSTPVLCQPKLTRALTAAAWRHRQR
ncbi:hypothetical protein [Plantactinospora sp. DSM 117369]